MYLECIFCFKGLPYQVPGVGVYVFADVNNHTGDVHCSGKRRTRTFRRSLEETPGSKFLKHACFHHMDPDWADRLLAEKTDIPTRDIPKFTRRTRLCPRGNDIAETNFQVIRSLVVHSVWGLAMRGDELGPSRPQNDPNGYEGKATGSHKLRIWAAQRDHSPQWEAFGKAHLLTLTAQTQIFSQTVSQSQRLPDAKTQPDCLMSSVPCERPPRSTRCERPRIHLNSWKSCQVDVG